MSVPMSPSESELPESSANLEIINSKLAEEEFELDMGVGGGDVDIYDDMLSRESVMVKEEESKGNENRTCQYPLDLNPPEREKNEFGLGFTKFNCLIGNLTWWTSEDDIQGALRSIGVYDSIGIKFVENRQTGLSKGYCCCAVKSNESLRLIHNNLGQVELNGQRLQVKPDTRDSVAYFESRDISKRKCSPNEEFPDVTPISSTMGSFGGSAAPRSAQKFPPNRVPPLLHPYQNGGFRFVPYAPGFRFKGHQPSSYRGPPGAWNCYANGQYRHQPPQVRLGYFSGAYKNWTSPRHPLDMQQGGTKSAPEDPSSSPIRAPGTSPISTMATPSRPFGLGDPPLASSTPAKPHINPDFVRRGLLPAVGPIESLLKNASQVPVGGFRRKKLPGSPSPPKLTPEEYQEAMAKNRMVSSSAISHAVKDAASGEFEDAIETLLMAISLLRQSKIASDDRVKVLISSLQDTLEGIESKNFELSHHGARSRFSRGTDSRDCYRRRSRSSSRHRVHRDFHERRDYSERERRRERDEYVPRPRHYYERSRHNSRDHSEYRVSKRTPTSDEQRGDRDRSRHDDSFSSRR